MCAAFFYHDRNHDDAGSLSLNSRSKAALALLLLLAFGIAIAVLLGSLDPRDSRLRLGLFNASNETTVLEIRIVENNTILERWSATLASKEGDELRAKLPYGKYEVWVLRDGFPCATTTDPPEYGSVGAIVHKHGRSFQIELLPDNRCMLATSIA